ncbi:RES family NAD+ phosphorylase [Shumkonia mesophila]|uniref:RES family NAD+ phosphorylase n=1 Tax=Shumkonia mesophila TaxID=2838854 RepID=UPI002934AC1A|nr:RES family NAD+ phosphorylase [Shumkonia mesophila]
MDDPKKPEFASWQSYEKFARRVRHVRRYVWDAEVRAFLDTVLATLRDRDVIIQKDAILCRAQRGIDYDPVVEDGVEVGEEPHGFGTARMKPITNRAREGRVNPAGIPVLYLASNEKTAISEVRPWVGSEISVAQFKILRDLRAVNLSFGHGQMALGQMTFAHLLGEEAPDAETKEKAVWIDIDSAFSRPITLFDDSAEYVPTQILAELFMDAGYDAIVYRSQFGEKGYNIALFNVDDAEAINCAPYRVTGIDVNFEEMGNRWFSTKHLESKKNESD